MTTVEHIELIIAHIDRRLRQEEITGTFEAALRSTRQTILGWKTLRENSMNDTCFAQEQLEVVCKQWPIELIEQSQ